MATQNLELAGPIKRTIKGHENWYYGGGEEAYQDRASALASVPVPVRIGQTVGIYESGKIVEYWWRELTTDEGLVLKMEAGGTSYTLPIATSTTLGGLKVGSTLSIDSTTGVLDVIPNLTRFGIEDTTSTVDRAMDLQSHTLSINNGDLHTNNGNILGFNTSIGLDYTDGSYAGLGNNGLTIKTNGTGFKTLALIAGNNLTSSNRGFELANFPLIDQLITRTIPMSVNGVFADESGDIALDISGSGGGASTRFGVSGEDDLATQNRYIDIAAHDFDISNASHIHLGAAGTGSYGGLHLYDSSVDLSSSTSGQGSGGFQSNATLSQISYTKSGSQKRVRINPNGIEFYQYNTTTDFDGIIRVPFVGAASTVTRYMPLSVNGIFANSNGNITLDLSGSGGGTASRFGIEDNTTTVNREFDLGTHTLDIIKNNNEFYMGNGGISIGGYVQGVSFATVLAGEDNINLQVANQVNNSFKQLIINSDRISFANTVNGIAKTSISLPIDNPSNGEEEQFIPLSVNGNFADSTGNITLDLGSGGGTALSLTTTGTSGASTYNSGTGVLNIPNYSTRFGTSEDATATFSRTFNTASSTFTFTGTPSNNGSVLYVNNTSTGGTGLYLTAPTTGIRTQAPTALWASGTAFGVVAEASTGNAVQAYSTNNTNQEAIQACVISDNTNGIVPILSLLRTTPGTPSAYMGSSIEFRTKTDATSPIRSSGRIIHRMTTPGEGAFKTQFEFECYHDGNPRFSTMVLKSTGTLYLPYTMEYADNAAAKTGGLENGDIYRTGDTLKIVHS